MNARCMALGRARSWILIVAAGWLTACGNTVIVERPLDDDPVEPSLAEELDDPPPSGCYSCAGWLDACDGALCPHRDQSCAAEEPALVDLLECMCAGCADVCGGSCELFRVDDDACLACQESILSGTCGPEYDVCIGR